MKDLYARLGIEPTAGDREIAEALKRQPALAAFATILLNPRKRAVYDGAHSTLKTIGALRYRLGLDKGESWFLHTHPDFAPALVSLAKKRRETPAAEVESRAESSPASAPAARKKSPISGIAVAVLLVAALAAIFLVLR